MSPSLYVIGQHGENNTENIDNEQNNNEENLGVAEQKNPWKIFFIVYLGISDLFLYYFYKSFGGFILSKKYDFKFSLLRKKGLNRPFSDASWSDLILKIEYLRF